MSDQAENTDNDVKIINRETVYDGFFQMDKYTLKHRMHEGGWTEEFTRELFERGHAVAILLYDPDHDAIVLTEQFRIGAYVAGFNAWELELAAGIIDEDETAEDVAKRETKEETGLEVSDLFEVMSYLSSPGGTSESVTLYCGRVDSTKADGIHGLDEEHEDIRVITLGVDAALKRLQNDEIQNATAVIALQWLALNRDRLRKKWAQGD